MAKRSRGSARPGQLAPSRRTPAQPRATRPTASTPAGTVRPTGSLTDAEEARAAELEQQILAEERAAEAARRRGRPKARGGELVATGGRGEGLIAVNTSREYAYVQTDLRRIVIQTGVLTGILVLLWVLIEVMDVKL